MKKYRIILPIFLIFVLISGCKAGKDAYALANEVKIHYNDMINPSLTAKVTADYGDRLAEYTLVLNGNEITILAPDEVSGVTARIGENGVSLIFGEAEIFSGEVTKGGLSPVSALPEMIDTWKSGVITSAWLEGDMLLVDYRITDSLSLRTQFDSATFAPLSAILTEDGGRVLSAEFEN